MKLMKIQCRVYIYGLPLEYWQLKAILSIVRETGTPLSLDDYIKNKSQSFFARILIDVDLLSYFSQFMFIVDVKYKDLSLFCSNCKMIGHDLSTCKRLQQDVNVILVERKYLARKYNNIIVQKWLVHKMRLMTF